MFILSLRQSGRAKRPSLFQLSWGAAHLDFNAAKSAKQARQSARTPCKAFPICCPFPSRDSHARLRSCGAFTEVWCRARDPNIVAMVMLS